jgi:hypothetical protein
MEETDKAKRDVGNQPELPKVGISARPDFPTEPVAPITCVLLLRPQMGGSWLHIITISSK